MISEKILQEDRECKVIKKAYLQYNKNGDFMIKKISIMLLIGICIIMQTVTVLADDEIDEDTSNIIEEVLSASTNANTVPTLNSRACLVLDRESKRVLFEKNGYTKRPMASTTKIMTSLIVLEKANLTDTVEISKKAGGTGGSRLGLKAGDKVSVNDLLYGLMLRSRK